MKKLLESFMRNELPNLLKSGRADNEFGLQFELGYYLRQLGYNVFFERNVSRLHGGRLVGLFRKKEIDLYIEKGGKEYAIELKYPLKGNSGGTAEIYHFVKDIEFAECLKANGVESYCITLTDSDEYTTRPIRGHANPLWKSFRGGYCSNNTVKATVPLQDTINQKVKKKNGGASTNAYSLKGLYPIVWEEITKNYWYYIIEAK